MHSLAGSHLEGGVHWPQRARQAALAVSQSAIIQLHCLSSLACSSFCSSILCKGICIRVCSRRRNSGGAAGLLNCGICRLLAMVCCMLAGAAASEPTGGRLLRRHQAAAAAAAGVLAVVLQVPPAASALEGVAGGGGAVVCVGGHMAKVKERGHIRLQAAGAAAGSTRHRMRPQKEQMVDCG
jgi:hypothetical protein